MREEDVECYSSDQVLVGVEGSFGSAFSSVRENDLAIGFGTGSEGDVESKVTGESESENVESRSDICGRSGNSDGPL